MVLKPDIHRAIGHFCMRRKDVGSDIQLGVGPRVLLKKSTVLNWHPRLYGNATTIQNV